MVLIKPRSIRAKRIAKIKNIGAKSLPIDLMLSCESDWGWTSDGEMVDDNDASSFVVVVVVVRKGFVTAAPDRISTYSLDQKNWIFDY